MCPGKVERESLCAEVAGLFKVFILVRKIWLYWNRHTVKFNVNCMSQKILPVFRPLLILRCSRRFRQNPFLPG